MRRKNMRKLQILTLLALTLLVIGIVYADQMVFSTYYPAPYGRYRQFSTTGLTTLATDEFDNEGPTALVGIGTTDPSYSLDVDGHIRIDHGNSLLLTNPTTENHIYLRNTGVGPQRSLSVHYTSAGAPVFFIDPYSRIGIGTTTPRAQLEISAGNENIKLLSFFEDDIQFKSFYAKSLFDPAFSGPRNRIVFGRDFTGLPDLDIFTLQDDGNVGIGTTNPTTDANPSGHAIGNLDVGDVWLRDANGGNGAWASESGGGWVSNDDLVYSANAPTSWSDLNLSGYVGSNKALVFLRIRLAPGTPSDAWMQFRPNGITDNIAVSWGRPGGCSTTMVNPGWSGYISVPTDANGIVEWRSDEAGDNTQIWLAGYIK